MAEQRFAGGPASSEPGADTSLEQALRRARQHARAAVSESLAALEALLDALSLVTSGRPAEAQRWLSPVKRTLEGLAAAFGAGSDGRAEPVLAALAEALDAEIARWEERARGGDTDARAVLRTFLGVRELLWELGVRSRETTGATPGRARGRAPGGGGRRRGPRVERVPVEG